MQRSVKASPKMISGSRKWQLLGCHRASIEQYLLGSPFTPEQRGSGFWICPGLTPVCQRDLPQRAHVRLNLGCCEVPEGQRGCKQVGCFCRWVLLPELLLDQTFQINH